MPRMKYPSIKDIAAEALRTVAVEAQVKTAEAQILRGVLVPTAAPRTELSAQLHKLAAECRKQSDDVTYADLEDFFHAR